VKATGKIFLIFSGPGNFVCDFSRKFFRNFLQDGSGIIHQSPIGMAEVIGSDVTMAGGRRGCVSG